MRSVFSEILAVEVENDGVLFNAGSLDVGPIREDQEYGGVRVVVIAQITSARVRLQIDVGFGDAITPAAVAVDLPSQTFAFDGEILVRAVAATFARRKPPLPSALPVALTLEFAADRTKNTQWRAFLRKAGAPSPGDLTEAAAVIARFVEEPLGAARRGESFARHWSPGGPWTWSAARHRPRPARVRGGCWRPRGGALGSVVGVGDVDTGVAGEGDRLAALECGSKQPYPIAEALPCRSLPTSLG